MHDQPPKAPPATPSSRDSFDRMVAAGLISQAGHSDWLGLAFHAESDDWVELALPWKAELAADAQSCVLASGPIISLMDTAAGLAVCRRQNRIVQQVTVDLRVDYMRAARPGRTVIGRGECYKVTRSIAFVRGVAYDGDIDDPVAHVAGTFILLHETPA